MKHFLISFFVVIFFLSATFVWGQNLLQNPGFEDWTGDSAHYWDKETTGYDLFRESGTVHSGSYSAKLILRDSSYTQRFTQYVTPINPGNEYEGTLYFFDNDPFIRARLYIRWFDGSGGWISSFWSSYSVDSTGWQELIAGPDSAPAAAETAHVEVRLYDVSGFTDSALICVDDASFVDLTSGVSETCVCNDGFSLNVFPTISAKSVHINLSINKQTNAKISIYSHTGRKIATLLQENLKEGEHTILWNGRNVPSGIYFVRLQMGEKTETKKVSIIR